MIPSNVFRFMGQLAFESNNKLSCASITWGSSTKYFVSDLKFLRNIASTSTINQQNLEIRLMEICVLLLVATPCLQSADLQSIQFLIVPLSGCLGFGTPSLYSKTDDAGPYLFITAAIIIGAQKFFRMGNTTDGTQLLLVRDNRMFTPFNG